jgi:hypothetical protein
MSEKLKLTVKQDAPSRVILKPTLYTYDAYEDEIIEVYEPKSKITVVPKTQLEQEFGVSQLPPSLLKAIQLNAELERKVLLKIDKLLPEST